MIKRSENFINFISMSLGLIALAGMLFLFVTSGYAEKIQKSRAVAVGRESLDKRDVSPKSAKAGSNTALAGAPTLGKEVEFQPGIDPNQTPPWSKWEPSHLEINANTPEEDPLAAQPLLPGPGTSLGSLDSYKTSPKDNPTIIALKIDDMIGGLSHAVGDLETNRSVTNRLPQQMMKLADTATGGTNRMYTGLQGMYGEMDVMKEQLDLNYATFNNSEQSEGLVSQFNVQSDVMAQRVSGMRKSLQGMAQGVENDRALLDDMLGALDEMGDNGQRALAYYDQLTGHVKNVANRFEGMVKDLQSQGLAGKESVEQTRKHLSSLQQYVQGNKPYTNDELTYIKDVKKYLQNTRDYFTSVLKDFEKTGTNLRGTELYFRKSKVELAEEPLKIISGAEEEGGGVCDGAKKEGLKELQGCSKDCRSVCRFKEQVNGINCYECPSGSPDTCFDLKPPAWPSNHPWCQSGGICHSDPMLYCVPFGAIGPNLEPLSCTNCKKRPDMCWQKVGDGTMTYTNCKMGCWDGKCVYKGKYQETEWDGTPEFIHCYKCETPPGPPTCEDLGWGYTWASDCEKNCPDGQCQSVNTKVPGAPQPPQPPGAGPGGEEGGGQPGAGGGSGGTAAGGKPPGDGDGKEANPPGGTPTQPGGGGGAIAGGGQPKGEPVGTPTGTPGPQAKTDAKPPQAPPTTTPQQPQQPNTESKPKPPDTQPPQPPDNPDIAFYKKWHTETRDRIQSREEIIASPKEGEYTKAEAQRQLETMTREREYLEGTIKEKEQKEIERQKQEAEAKKRQEEYERTRPRTKDFGEEMRRRSQQWHLAKLKEATDQLKSKLQEMKDVLGGRRQRLETINREVAQLESEIKHINESAAANQYDKSEAETRTRERQKRIDDLKKTKAHFAKKLQELQRQYNEELAKLKSEYQKRYWAVDENARRRAEAERIDEYFDLYNELRHRRATREARNQTFDQMATSLENAIKDKEAKGEDASELRRQLENLRRGQAEWNETQSKQEDYLEHQLHEMNWRNFSEGAGPSSPESLGDKLGQYAGYMEQEITSAEKAIADLERAGTRTAEQNQKLNNLKAKVNDLRSALADLKAKQEFVKSPYQLTPDNVQRILDSTTRVAAGAMKRDADKSFARLFAESLGEEYVHNLNPLVAGKKTVAFSLGVAKGVGSAVKDLAKLGWEVVDTIGEAVAVDLGFEEGGIFGTENLDALNKAFTTVSSNTNFDGLIKAAVAAGGAIDAQLKKLEKSGDIDWATAEFGGKVAGEVVVADALVAGALGKAGTALRGADDLADAGRAAGKLDDIADAGRAGTKVDDAAKAGSTATQKFEPFEPPGTSVVDDAADASRAAGKVETPPARGPPDTPVIKPDAPAAPSTQPRAGIGPNAQATVTGPNGQPVTIKTGEELGHGSTSTVFADATNPKKAIRITEPGKGGITEAPALDRAGRQAVESIQRPGGPIRIAEKGEPFTVTDPNSPLKGKVVEVVERVENGSADKFLKNQPGGTMTGGQSRAFAEATQELNKNGFAWMDNHTGNYGFEKVPGTADDWRVVVLDPGGIVPMKGSTLAEKAANASALQRRINVPEEGMADLVNSASPGFRQNIAKLERGAIFEEFGNSIDAAAMGLRSPHDIAFYPFGTTEFPEVQRLFR